MLSHFNPMFSLLAKHSQHAAEQEPKVTPRRPDQPMHSAFGSITSRALLPDLPLLSHIISQHCREAEGMNWQLSPLVPLLTTHVLDFAVQIRESVPEKGRQARVRHDTIRGFSEGNISGGQHWLVNIGFWSNPSNPRLLDAVHPAKKQLSVQSTRFPLPSTHVPPTSRYRNFE